MNVSNAGAAAIATISPSRKLVTLFNVFTVEPANQRKLLYCWPARPRLPCAMRKVSFATS